MDKLKESVESIPLPKDLHIRARMGVSQVKKKRKKTWLIPSVATVFLASSITVGAAMNDNVKNLLWHISPDIAALLEPIESIVEQDGIKMEIVSAMQDEDMAVVYVTMQDLEGNRIDETLDIYDYFMSKGRSFTVERIGFDATTKTALVRFMSFNGSSTDNFKLKIRSFLSDKSVLEDVTFPQDLQDVEKQQTEILPDDTIRGSGGESREGGVYVLPAGKLNIQTPLYDRMRIKNIGLHNDKLYVQTEWPANNAIEHGEFYLVNPAGQKILPTENYSYGRDAQGKPIYAYNYEENIFNVKDINVAEYELQAKIYTAGQYVEGDWEATFKLEEMRGQSVPFAMDFGDWKAKELKVSPLGLTIIGEGDATETEELTATIVKKDGSHKELKSLVSFSDENQVKLKLLSEEPLKLDQIKSIMVNGFKVNF
ncbi:hypothetical protein ABH966_004466 [Lysinibacillus sp. RC46]|uniref:hypothetical protein n=1 Tax=Lysinibacillus sp. RC46 TaxID=3156295 RepID=UPI0035183978